MISLTCQVRKLRYRQIKLLFLRSHINREAEPGCRALGDPQAVFLASTADHLPTHSTEAKALATCFQGARWGAPAGTLILLSLFRERDRQDRSSEMQGVITLSKAGHHQFTVIEKHICAMSGRWAHLFVLLVSPNITHSFPPSLLDGKENQEPRFFVLFCFLIAGFWKITQISDYLVFIDFSILTRRSEILWTQDFPASPAVKTSPSSEGGVGSIPGWEAKIPHASRP